MKYCRSCGAPLLDGFRFCVQCGATADSDTAVDRPDEDAAEVTAAEVTAPEAPASAPNVSGMPAYVPDRAEPVSAPVPTPTPVPAPQSASPCPAAPVPAEKVKEAKPAGLLSFDGAFVALLLFCLPGIGLITGIIWALGGAKNPSRKNLARAYLLLVLALALFFGCMALLLHLIAGDQMARFFDLLRSWLSAQ